MQEKHWRLLDEEQRRQFGGAALKGRGSETLGGGSGTVNRKGAEWSNDHNQGRRGAHSATEEDGRHRSGPQHNQHLAQVFLNSAEFWKTFQLISEGDQEGYNISKEKIGQWGTGETSDRGNREGRLGTRVKAERAEEERETQEPLLTFRDWARERTVEEVGRVRKEMVAGETAEPGHKRTARLQTRRSDKGTLHGYVKKAGTVGDMEEIDVQVGGEAPPQPTQGVSEGDQRKE